MKAGQRASRAESQSLACNMQNDCGQHHCQPEARLQPLDFEAVKVCCVVNVSPWFRKQEV